MKCCWGSLSAVVLVHPPASRFFVGRGGASASWLSSSFLETDGKEAALSVAQEANAAYMHSAHARIWSQTAKRQRGSGSQGRASRLVQSVESARRTCAARRSCIQKRRKQNPQSGHRVF